MLSSFSVLIKFLRFSILFYTCSFCSMHYSVSYQEIIFFHFFSCYLNSYYLSFIYYSYYYQHNTASQHKISMEKQIFSPLSILGFSLYRIASLAKSKEVSNNIIYNILNVCLSFQSFCNRFIFARQYECFSDLSIKTFVMFHFLC